MTDHDAPRPWTAGPVVVGHDGSSSSDAALDWALAHAAAVDVPVRVVRGWNISTAPRPKGTPPGGVPGVEELGRAVQEALEVDTDAATSAYPHLQVSCHAVHGAAADVLLRESRDASVVVVGARGLGGFAGLLLGSVVDRVVRHASCPVLVVRRPDDASRPRNGLVDSVLGSVLD